MVRDFGIADMYSREHSNIPLVALIGQMKRDLRGCEPGANLRPGAVVDLVLTELEVF